MIIEDPDSSESATSVNPHIHTLPDEVTTNDPTIVSKLTGSRDHELQIDDIDQQEYFTIVDVSDPVPLLDIDNTSCDICDDITSCPARSVDLASNSSSSSNSSLHFVGVEQQGGLDSSVFVTKDGVKYWKPDVPVEYVPVINQTFKSWDDVARMYHAYAAHAGFSARLSAKKSDANGKFTHRYMVCNKSGKPKFQDFDSSNATSISSHRRRSRFTVSGCTARIRIRTLPDSTFELYEFIEAHNHCLVDPNNADFTSKRRKLSYTDQHFIHKLSLNKVGPNVSHNLQCSLKGGHHNVRGTKTDYKNFNRDIRLYIGDKDAQMIVDTLSARAINLSNFYFEFTVVGNKLRSLFWADDVSLRNYESFGDVLAFDATYHTNMYNMIFVPFTGVDHHKNCVTFGDGLLYDEKIESYDWLLRQFLNANKNKQPRLVLTDQDASMKQAVAVVFDQSIHRLCMWHVMKKLPSKISGDILDNTNLRASIHKLVWNLYITTDTFEERWQLLMKEHDLTGHPWLSEMYSIRDHWIPSYFRDIPMCCLMKTTSRCESSNALFKIKSKGCNTLVQFLLCFGTTIDGQRYNQRKMEFESDTTVPLMLTNMPIERRASEIYTRTIFLEVQKEIHRGLYYCFITSSSSVDDVKHYTVAHTDKRCNIINEFKVDLNLRDKTASCSCMCFTRIGYICRHIFCVFRFNNIDSIPTQYQTGRWKRDALPKSVYNVSNRYSDDTSEETMIRNDIIDSVFQGLDRLRCNREQLIEFGRQLNDLKRIIFKDIPDEPAYNAKSAVIGDLLGQTAPTVVTINPPQGIRNKGCGTNKRLIGPGEKAIENSTKSARLCSVCNKYVTDHDARNCLKVQAAKEAAAKAAAAKAAAERTSGGINFDLPAGSSSFHAANNVASRTTFVPSSTRYTASDDYDPDYDIQTDTPLVPATNRPTRRSTRSSCNTTTDNVLSPALPPNPAAARPVRSTRRSSGHAAV